jgi:hypothetical protein
MARCFVYFIQAGDQYGPIKIGTAVNVTKRLESLQTANAEELRVLAFFEANPAIEGVLHGHFRDEHIRGEWFGSAPELSEFVRRVRQREFPSWVLPYVETEDLVA